MCIWWRENFPKEIFRIFRTEILQMNQKMSIKNIDKGTSPPGSDEVLNWIYPPAETLATCTKYMKQWFSDIVQQVAQDNDP